MSITTVADMTNSVTVRYEKEYLLHGDENPGVWAQFVDWKTPVGTSGGGGSSFDFPVYDEGTPVEDALTENADVTPQTIDDGNLTITPYEWGGTFSTTKKLTYQSRTNLPEVMGKKCAMQRVISIDRVLRRAACGRGSSYPTMTMMPSASANAVMTDLTGASSTDCVTFDFIMDMVAQAQSLGIEPWKEFGYVSVVHPLVMADLYATTEWKNIGYYQDSKNIYSPWGKPITIGSVTFIPSPRGRLHLGSGTAIRTADTLSAAYAKGSVSIVASNDRSWAVGDYVTLGTAETESANPGNNREQLLVTGVSTVTLTVRGDGANENFGTRYDHAIGEAISTGYNVASIPLLGKNSLVGVYGSDCGPYGETITKLGTLDLLNRFSYFGWRWYGGVSAVQKKIVLGRVATKRFTIGIN
jgi:N4-gp56 family major capsid protein